MYQRACRVEEANWHQSDCMMLWEPHYVSECTAMEPSPPPFLISRPPPPPATLLPLIAATAEDYILRNRWHFDNLNNQ